MVVADEDPPRKRSRLSLKSKKGDSTPVTEDSESPPPLQSAGMVPQGPPLKSEEEATDCSPPVIDLTESDLPSDGPGVPPVASMENLGNTCFLNSVLEVLRYTPCFLEGLEELYRHIVYLEKIKASEVVQDSEEVKTDPSLAWDLVKNMFKMYKKMEKREEMFTQFANADVTSMAVKPDKVLDVIREFNPMFEGNMQHDAQEVLRCMLCYLEDSERELHSDYASILALDPSLLKTPGPHETSSSSSKETERQGGTAIMEKFLAAGKSKLNRGKSAISALKFDQPWPETMPSECADGNPRAEHDSACFKRSSMSKPDFLDSVVGGCKEEKVPESGPEVKKRKFRHTRLRKVEEMEEEDEVDSIGKNHPVSPVSVPLSSEEVDEGMEKGQVLNSSDRHIRRSVRQKVINKRSSGCMSQHVVLKGKRTCRSQPKVSSVREEKDTQPTVGSEALKRPENSVSGAVVNGDCVEKPVTSVDKSQPTILSMLGKKTGQCRRLGMRGRVVHTQPDSQFSPPVSPRSPEVSPEPRRSPRKPNSARPVAVTMSPRKQNGIMTPSASPARPDEFPSHAVSRNSGAGMDHTLLDGGDRSPHKSPVTAQTWTMGEPDSPEIIFQSRNDGKKTFSSKPKQAEAEDTDSTETGPFQDELPDIASLSDVEADLGHHLSKGVTSPVKSRLEKMLASKTKPAGLVSPVRVGSFSPSLQNNREGRSMPVNPHPSKLMIKLEKCDHLCNTPTISASAALKALKGTTSTCRKMMFNENESHEVGKDEVDEDDNNNNNNEQDSDEDEVSLGTKSSFKSVPLKSVCVKVEKCDMVCDSPEKSVSARFATNCLARQRVQRFNMIEKLFQGTMMMRTKCLECERCTERKECFQDVSVPLSAEGSTNSDSESDEEKDSSLLRLMRAFTDVEHLRDDNKYYCEQCFRYVEAERSLHYESLPNILTVHLKRFSATGMFGCLSKINDYVTVPLLLSCLRYKCPKACVRPDHRYTLYAIITHAGSTISAGHYLSYIKVRPNAVGHETLSTYLNSTPVKKLHNSHHDDHIFDNSSSPQQPEDPGLSNSPTEKTKECPHQKLQPATVSEKGDWSSCLDSQEQQSGSELMQMSSCGDGEDQVVNDSHPADYHWLECDDETIRILSEKEFHGRLLERDGALRGTPYVLFYHRLDAWNAK